MGQLSFFLIKSIAMTFLTCVSHHVRLHLCYVLTSELLDSLEGEPLHFVKEAQTTSQSDHRRLRFLDRVEAAALTHTLLSAGHRECFHANSYKVESSAEMVSMPTCLAIMSFVLWDAPASPFALGISFGSEGLLDRMLSAFDTHRRRPPPPRSSVAFLLASFAVSLEGSFLL